MKILFKSVLLFFFTLSCTICFSQMELFPKRFTSMKEALKNPLEVTILDLSEKDLKKLPADIVELQNLETLWMDSNPKLNLESAMILVAQLPKLKLISLTNSGLTEIPDDISNLKNLEELWLGSNPNLDFEVTFDQLAEMENLKFLDISNCALPTIPENIVKLKNLEVLWLDDNFIEIFPEPVKKMNRLKELKFFSNKLSHLDFEIGDLPNLEIIDLCYNEFSRFPVQLSVLPKLKEIIMWYNIVSEIPEGIDDFKKLEKLNLDNNRITKLPAQFAMLDSLKGLSLRFNQLTTEGIRPLYGLANLTNLDLQGSQITSLTKEVANWKKMKNFSISGNPIFELPIEFRELKEVQQLGFGELQQINWESTFSILSALPNLRRVGMFSMNLMEMPNGFEKLQQVDTFWLTFNLFDESERARIKKMVPNAEISW